MRNHYVSFLSANQATLAEEDIVPDSLKAGEAIVRGEHSIVSSGTEGATYTDLVSQMLNLQNLQRGWPRRTGYGHLGRVVATGPGVTNVKEGDRILTFSNHGSHTRANVGRFALHVSDGVTGQRAVATRMAGVSATALRSSSVQPGDRVAIIGLGLVGNFAAQLFQLAGARVLGLDVAPRRLEIARACGIHEVANATDGDPVARVREWSGDDQGVEIAIDAIGHAPIVAQAVDMTRRHGEVILLGSPRAHHSTDVTPMLTRIHLLAIRMIGALEWTYPIPASTERSRFTIERNYKQILEWIIAGRLIADPLISHVMSPRDCQVAYDGLTNKKDEYTAVIFDWSLL